ncbi:MAG: hypothetical protein KDC27_04315 [Acidobacteria bacterium]|nr:hypothetical protein [Acidobacteriota bacterium]
MRKRTERAHTAGLFSQLIGRMVGKGQALIAAGDAMPLVVARYPRGRAKLVTALEDALRHTFPALPASLRERYQDALEQSTPVVIADLRRHNPCTCLGHHHPPSSHSAFARAFAAETGRKVGEIDLAIDAIREWEPLPLSGLAAAAWVPDCDRGSKAEFAEARFHAAVLSVFLHELEHLAFPERPEQLVRERSNEFYIDALQAQLSSSFGLQFGFSGSVAA